MEISVERPIQAQSVSIYTGTVTESIYALSKEKVIIFELSEYDKTIILTRDEFTTFTENDLVKHGQGGTCDICERDCGTSANILDTYYDFFTFCDTCYTMVTRDMEQAYDRNQPKIVSQLL